MRFCDCRDDEVARRRASMLAPFRKLRLSLESASVHARSRVQARHPLEFGGEHSVMRPRARGIQELEQNWNTDRDASELDFHAPAVSGFADPVPRARVREVAR
jgi:hypothetical protein